MKHTFLILALGVLAMNQSLKANDNIDAILANLDSDKVQAYIDAYQHIAVMEMDRVGIPASIKMAQGILESGSGQSELARNAKNHFGIKCGGVWEGDTYYVWDDEVVKSCFRVYESVEECYIAHSEFLTDPKKEYRYGPLFELERDDYKGWAKGLKKAGYATSKTYDTKLISLIERYELFKLDQLTSIAQVETDTDMDEMFGLGEPEVLPEHPNDLFQPVPDDIVNAAMNAISIPDPFREGFDTIALSLTVAPFQIQGLKTVFIQEDETPQSLSQRYNISTKKLAKYNEWAGQSLTTGRYIFLEKKNKKYTGKTRFPYCARRGDDV